MSITTSKKNLHEVDEGYKPMYIFNDAMQIHQKECRSKWFLCNLVFILSTMVYFNLHSQLVGDDFDYCTVWHSGFLFVKFYCAEIIPDHVLEEREFS